MPHGSPCGSETLDCRDLVNEYLQGLEDARTGTGRQAGESDAQNVHVEQNAADTQSAAASKEVKYSIDPNFDRRIVAWDESGRRDDQVFALGTTGDALKSIGAADKSIVMVSDKIRKILADHPTVTIDMIRQIPQMLEEPALVLESQGKSIRNGNTKNSRVVVIGTVTDANGAPMLCALDLAPSTSTDIRLGLQDFNKVSSAYAKDVNPSGFLRNSNVLYANPDTKITEAALNSFGFKLATTELNRLGSIGSIAYTDDGVKMQGVPFDEIFGEQTKIEAPTEKQLARQNAARTTDNGGVASKTIIEKSEQSVKDAAKSNTKFSLKVPVEETKDLVAVTKIRTIHTRSDFAKLINDESVLYLNENKRKTKEWFQVRGNRVPLEGTGFGLIRSIQLGEENVKRGDEVYSKKAS